MKILRKATYLFLIAFLPFSLFSCKQAATTETAEESTDQPAAERTYKEAPMIEPDEFEKGMKRSKAVLVDVRMPQEFEQGHMEGALNLNSFDPN